MKPYRLSLLVLTLLCAVLPGLSQILNPVSWTTSLEMKGDDRGEVVMTATIEPGWHMYTNNIPDDGPTALSIDFSTLKGVKLDGTFKADQKAHQQHDDMFDMELSWWTGKVTLRQAFIATEPQFEIGGTIVCGACNDQNCIPPYRESFSLNGTAKVKAAAKAEAAPAAAEEAAVIPAAELTEAVETTDSAKSDTVAATAPVPAGTTDIWAPVTYPDGSEGGETSGSLWYVFFTCFLGGLVALLTPCVWPMIPMTVSFFLKKGKSSAKAVGDALTYGVSLIVIYMAMGLIITWIFGASALNAMSTSAICNIIFFLLLVVFAISFFGAFDIQLPSSWSNRMDSTAEKTTGLLSIFFMAFTLALVSFSCTGPIIGTLLVEAVSSGNQMGPAIGMFGFSLALAIPFCLFAMFPSWLQKAPKSGSWMNTVKVVLGFIELALSLKFLSVADLAYGWHILDREVFIVLWIAMFVLLGMYLLGQFNFSHYGKANNSVGVFRFCLALVSLSFAMYLVPGLWGAPLKGVSAFVPPLYTQDFNLYGHEFTEYSDFDEGMAVAAKENKPVFIDFSGYGCVNCRKMEGAVLDNADVRTMIEDNFVVIKLMVDEKKELPEPITVEEYGKKITLVTYGDRYSYLQRYKFNANAQPYYVIVNPKGELLSGPFSYDEDIPKFVDFLEKGIDSFKK